MTLEEQVAVIDTLTPEQQDWFGMICCNEDKGVPAKVAQALMVKELICKSGGGYDVVSYWVHYAWCKWAEREVNKNASNRSKQDQKRPKSHPVGGSKSKRPQ